jgi:hypothetical protein
LVCFQSIRLLPGGIAARLQSLPARRNSSALQHGLWQKSDARILHTQSDPRPHKPVEADLPNADSTGASFRYRLGIFRMALAIFRPIFTGLRMYEKLVPQMERGEPDLSGRIRAVDASASHVLAAALK